MKDNNQKQLGTCNYVTPGIMCIISSFSTLTNSVMSYYPHFPNEKWVPCDFLRATDAPSQLGPTHAFPLLYPQCLRLLGTYQMLNKYLSNEDMNKQSQ